MRRAGIVLMLALALAAPAEAKKFKYASGPKPPADTVYSEAQPQIEPIVRERGPRVPATNLQVTSLVANTAFERAMAGFPLQQGMRVIVAPAESHPLNFVVEHAILRQLSKRNIVAVLPRTPADSTAATTDTATVRLLDYQLASARVSYLRLVGWLPGRVKVERQALVEGRLTLRNPATSQVLWVGDASYSLVDRFPKSQIPLVEDDRFTDLKGPVPDRGVTKLFEPIVVIAVVAGLVALFFQNRP